ncbi:hypothetical protein D4764_07G0003880 [Takifugu flavidus]|uniref:Uncharacterized protein n=1 Tax=Takifugu flavidus TaxID=433684 RepID=A0A5C6MSE4_9TELE|nr:hypothetical protein D4764_07G0003880 [Takifugu flavidus]
MLSATALRGRWKEYFEDLLNPTNTPSSEEVGPGDLGIGSHISGAEVAEVYSGVLERRVRRIVEPRIQEEQCGFRPGCGTEDQLYTLSGVFQGAWEFAQPVHMCFVDLEKAFDRVPRGVLWGVLREYGVSGPLIRAVRSLYDRCQSLVRIAGTAGMKISTSKSEAMVLNRKSVKCLHRVKEEILPQVEEFNYLGVLFTSEGRMEREIDRRI